LISEDSTTENSVVLTVSGCLGNNLVGIDADLAPALADEAINAGSEHNAANLGERDGAHAHGARLGTGVEGGSLSVVAGVVEVEGLGSRVQSSAIAEGLDLTVGSVLAIGTDSVDTGAEEGVGGSVDNKGSEAEGEGVGIGKVDDLLHPIAVNSILSGSDGGRMGGARSILNSNTFGEGAGDEDGQDEDE